MMVAPGTQDVVSSRSSQRRTKGTIASRYLESIGIQCGGNLSENVSKIAFRSTPIVKTHKKSDIDNNYYNSRDSNKHNNRATRSMNVYDKINATASIKPADCSKSIITASTTVMLDHSDSISTSATSPGGSGDRKHHRNSPNHRPLRRGRSPTSNKSGTNNNNSSRSRSYGNRMANESSNQSATSSHDDCNYGSIHLPGSRSTAPLSDGLTSAPSTPSRLNRLRNQLWEGERSNTRIWSDHTSKAFSCNNGGSNSPMTPLTAKSIMGIDNSNSDSTCSDENSRHPDSRLGLAPPPNVKNVTALSCVPLPLSSPHSHNRGRALFNRTNPRMPSDSPGPQPRSTWHVPVNAQHQEQGSSRSLFDRTPNTTVSVQSQHRKEDDLSPRSYNNPQPHRAEEALEAAPPSSHYEIEFTDSEAGAPTEIIKNHRSLDRPHHLRDTSTGTVEAGSLFSPHQSEPTDSEAGAPTEIMKNHRLLHRPYHHRRPSTGDGGSQLLLKDRRSSSNKSMDILSRVRSRYHNQQNPHKGQQHQQQNKQRNDQGKASIPSLLDSQSCSVSSSILPLTAAQAEGAPASILSPSPASRPSSRLSRHVENARKKSILSPCTSETTASLQNEGNANLSLTTEIGSSQDRRIATKHLSSLLSAKATTVETETKTVASKLGGRLRRPVGARVAALEAQYRKGNFTVRGARPRPQQRDEDPKTQGIEHQEEGPLDDENLPDPILGVSLTSDENDRQYNEHYNKTEEEEEDYDYDYEGKGSDEDSGKRSNNSQDREVYGEDDEESTIPEYSSNQNNWGIETADEGEDLASDFIAYNDRQTPNTDGVFQFQSKKGKSVTKGKKTSNKTMSARSKVHTSRGRDRGGKSPIQPLFSSERLDENIDVSIRESSIRSKSLGRLMTSGEFLMIANNQSYHPSNFSKDDGGEKAEGLPRRSKSLSERSKRQHHHDHQPVFSMELHEATRTIARDRRRRSKSKSRSNQEESLKPIPGNIVVHNESSKNDDGAVTSRSESSATRSSNPSQASRSFGAKSPGNRDVSLKESPRSIKSKIRTLNLKKSQISYNTTGVLSHENTSVDRKLPGSIQEASFLHGTNSRNRDSLSKRTQEEKKEYRIGSEPSDEHEDHSSVKIKRSKLDRKSLWARHFVENGSNDDDDENVSITNDEYSVQSLREQFEQITSTSQNDCAGDEEDDMSVKSLRDVFEPPTRKQTGETINNLKARFEPKRQSSRLSFTKHTRLVRKGNRGTEESNLKTGMEEKTFLQEPTREEPDSTEQVEGPRDSERTDTASKSPQSYQWWKLQDTNSPQIDDNNNVETTPMFKSVHNQLNDWSKRRHIERKSIVVHSPERRRNSNESNPTIGGTPSCDGKTERANMSMSERNESSISSQHQVLGAVETRQALLKDNNRRVSGTHWTSKSNRSVRENEKGIKESSSDSIYSDAVTLDPSFADVSNLSNPSAIRSLPSSSSDIDRQSDASSSVLFENLEYTESIADLDRILGPSNSEIAHPELKNSGRDLNNVRTVPKNSNDTNRDSSLLSVTQSCSKSATENGRMHTIEDLHRAVTPDSGHGSGIGVHSFNRVDCVDSHDHDYGFSVIPNDVLSGSRGVVSPMQGSLYHPDHGMVFESPIVSSRAMDSSQPVLESMNHSSRTMDTPYQNFEASSRPMENSHRGVDSTNRSIRFSDVSPQAFESSYQSIRSEDIPTDAPRQVYESSYRSNQSVFNPNWDVEILNSKSEESTRDAFESSYRSAQSIGTPQRSNRSTQPPDSPKPRLSNIPDNFSPLSNRHKSNPLDSEETNDYSPSRDESRSKIIRGSQNITSPPVSKPPVVPAMPSPFDENYATIMESRHKMLLVRQRALLNRRANREKLQNSQQRFFGRTNPGNIDANRSSSNRNYRDPRSSTDDKERSEPKAPKTTKARNPSNGSETPTPLSKEEHNVRSPGAHEHDHRRAKKNIELGAPHIVASIFSRIRPTFGAPVSKEKGTSQKQAVIDRISAVRAARLRRNQAYGDTSSSKSYRLEKVDPEKLGTIDDSISDPVPGYRYYPHNESNEPNIRDDDQSLSTHESNAQEYAAKLSID